MPWCPPEWTLAIDDAMDRARVGIMLVSRDFCASEYIRDNELPGLCAQADRRPPETVLLWLSLDGTEPPPQLAERQAVAEPEPGLANLTPARQDEIIAQLVDEVAANLAAFGIDVPGRGRP